MSREIATSMVSYQYAISSEDPKMRMDKWEFQIVKLPWGSESKRKSYRISGAVPYSSFNVTIVLPNGSRIIELNDGCWKDETWLQWCQKQPYSNKEECSILVGSENLCAPAVLMNQTEEETVVIQSRVNVLSAEVVYE